MSGHRSLPAAGSPPESGAPEAAQRALEPSMGASEPPRSAELQVTGARRDVPEDLPRRRQQGEAGHSALLPEMICQSS
ncbi:hypothetical protein Y1Q_0010425 [Alligator mississippiensis]|uniref:Uncharacterized protein n=1 Tax=Alligator mississippiensis TaxID=8496 RepID=A0A151NGU3_ALLMI|nr:hypothetical protein Y1Q_0010425 [Alligator mississippiensis]